MRILRTHHLYGKNGITGMGRTKFFAALASGDFPEPDKNLRNNPDDSEKVRPIHGWKSSTVEKWFESQ